MATRTTDRRNDEGIALILVLLLIVLLSAITFEYAYETQVEASLAANGRGDMEAYVAAKSAVAVGMSLLMGDQMQDVYGEYAEGQQPPVAPDPQQQMGFGEYDCKWTDVWGQPIVQQINEATMHCNIEDECGKLNLNALSDVSMDGKGPDPIDPNNPNPTDPVDPNDPAQQGGANPDQKMQALEQVLRLLFDQMELEVNPTDAIMDWLDSDDETRPEGAESDYYESLETPYACKNGPMESIEELLLVAGITPEIYFDLNRDPEETQELRDQEDELYPPSSLPDLLTVIGSIQGKINVNTARPELLMAIFEDPAAVETIVAAQMQTPFQDISEVGLAGAATDMQSLLDVKSNVFRIQGDGFVGDIMVRVEAYVVRPDPYSEVPMPFRILSWRVIR